jgi:hypothetical protein
MKHHLVLFLVIASADVNRILPNFNSSFAKLDNLYLRARSMPLDPRGSTADSTYIITSSCCGYGPFTEENVTRASNFYGLFDVPCLFDNVLPYVAEYGYEFMNNQNNIFPLCGNLTEASYKNPPTNRTEAYNRLQLYWQCRAAADRNRTNQPFDSPVVAEIGHYLFASMTALMDTSTKVIPGSEIGENINSIQAHIAHIRGAARQFNAPFVVDFSAWMQGWILDYSTPPGFWGSSSSSPIGGHSLSLFKRAYFSTFMSGANMLVAEAGAVNYFFENITNGVFNLSPLGEIGKTLYAFSHGFGSPVVASRGIPFVPIGIVSELSFGAGLGWFYNSLAWDVFSLSDAELATQSLLDALFEGSFQVESQFGTSKSESGYMVGGLFGDVVDLLLPRNLTADMMLNSYAVIFLTGIGSDLDETLAEEIQKYVNGGGSIILSASEAADAISKGWLTPDFLGFTSLTSPFSISNLSTIKDLQTDWSRPVNGIQPFCVEASTSSFYIKTGGDPTVRNGWDGGTLDKCCSTDASSCRWFSSLSECEIALPLSSILCRSCTSLENNLQDVGCPSWSSITMNVFGTQGITSAKPLLVLIDKSGNSTPCALLNSHGEGKGNVVTLLVDSTSVALSESGLGLAKHLLQRLTDEIVPVSLFTNITSGEPGVELLINRAPTGWLLTLINNNGVTKQPNSEQKIDSSQDINVLVSLKSSFGVVTSAWLSVDGKLPTNDLPVIGGQNVTLQVPAGDLAIVFLQIQGEK